MWGKGGGGAENGASTRGGGQGATVWGVEDGRRRTTACREEGGCNAYLPPVLVLGGAGAVVDFSPDLTSVRGVPSLFSADSVMWRGKRVRRGGREGRKEGEHRAEKLREMLRGVELCLGWMGGRSSQCCGQHVDGHRDREEEWLALSVW